MKQHGEFIWKLLRNCIMFGGTMFFAMYATQEPNYLSLKPILVFMGTYLFSELTHYYGVPSPRGSVKMVVF